MAELCGRPLTFGDPEQIAEINRQHKKDEARLGYEKGKEARTLKKFRICYEVIKTTKDKDIIEALNADHAAKLFLEQNKNREDEVEITSIKEV